MRFYRGEQSQLFSEGQLAERLSGDLRRALEAADVLDLKDHAGRGADALADVVVCEHATDPIRLQLDGVDAEVVEEPSQVGGPTSLLVVRVPYSGHGALLNCRPSNPPPEPSYGDLDGRDVMIKLLAEQDHEEAERKLRSRLRNLELWVDEVNWDISHARARLEREVSARLKERLASRARSADLLRALQLPTRSVPAERRLDLPPEPERVVIRKSESVAAEAAPYLADQDYLRINQLIERFGRALERRSSSASQLVPNEETLRDWIVFILNANLEGESGSELFVTGESVNGTGKTDILVRHRDKNVFIGECKFWDGSAKFRSAVDQLLGYLSWRDVRASVLLFVRNQAVPSHAIELARREIRQHGGFLRMGDPEPGTSTEVYILQSSVDPEVEIHLTLIPLVITGDRS